MSGLIFQWRNTLTFVPVRDRECRLMSVIARSVDIGICYGCRIPALNKLSHHTLMFVYTLPPSLSLSLSLRCCSSVVSIMVVSSWTSKLLSLPSKRLRLPWQTWSRDTGRCLPSLFHHPTNHPTKPRGPSSFCVFICHVNETAAYFPSL